MGTDAISPLRQRMIEDMSARQLSPPTQKSHIRACKRFAAFLKRPPETAAADDIRRFQLHLAESAMTICHRNRTMTGYDGVRQPAARASPRPASTSRRQPQLRRDGGPLRHGHQRPRLQAVSTKLPPSAWLPLFTLKGISLADDLMVRSSAARLCRSGRSVQPKTCPLSEAGRVFPRRRHARGSPTGPSAWALQEMLRADPTARRRTRWRGTRQMG